MIVKGFCTKRIYVRFGDRSNEKGGWGGGARKTYLAKDVLARSESQECIGVVHRVRRSNIDHVYIWISNQLFVVAVGIHRIWSREVDILQELLGSFSRRGRSDRRNDVLDVRDVARRRIDQQVLDERFGDATGSQNPPLALENRHGTQRGRCWWVVDL